MLLCTAWRNPVPRHTSNMAVESQGLGHEGENLGRARVDSTCYTYCRLVTPVPPLVSDRIRPTYSDAGSDERTI
jgi:hypothetical protein